MAKSKSRKYAIRRRHLTEHADRDTEPAPNAIPLPNTVAVFSDVGLPPPWRRLAVFQNLKVLITAFEEVDEYHPQRHHNRPPPALWLDDSAYLTDLKTLLHELRELNKVLRELAAEDRDPPQPVAMKVDVAIGVLGVAGKKFVESYADALGKGAAALTIGAIAGLCVSVSLPKELLDDIWGHFKGNR
jgi:hypothetical protein